MNCAHCNKPDAPNKWTVEVCADTAAKRVRYLCDPCDLELNAQVLRFFRVKNTDEMVRRYSKET